MHHDDFKIGRHAHDFGGATHHAERRTRGVLWLTAAMMVIEIIAGMAYGSMALLADGWHMATHVAAFGIAVFAYRYARQHAHDPRFTFGTGKVSVLGGFASAMALGAVAVLMVLESLIRLFEPHAIHFNQAIWVAVLGLLVNLASGALLAGGHAHEHDHEEHHAHHHDHNLRAAYLHVLADALTSVLAIAALLAGKYAGWMWLDPAMGLVGAAVIGRWALGLLRDTGAILLDSHVDEATLKRVSALIEADADNRVADLHLWYVGPAQLAASISVVTHQPRAPAYYKQLLAPMPELAHVQVEVNPCIDPQCSAGE